MWGCSSAEGAELRPRSMLDLLLGLESRCPRVGCGGGRHPSAPCPGVPRGEGCVSEQQHHLNHSLYSDLQHFSLYKETHVLTVHPSN